MILLSVLGTGDYKPTKYSYNNIVTDGSKFTVIALKQIFNPEKIFVVMTEKAKQTHGLELMSLCEIDEISVPEGKNHDELWDFFQKIVDKIPESSELILDVTHGFRSQPMILLAIVIYLQTVKNIKIKHIVYGAFDVKDANGNSQFFDLILFLELIEWSFATKLFIDKGIISPISTLLVHIHQQAYKNQSEYLPKGLKNLGNNLQLLEIAFNSIRFNDIISFSKNIKSIIDDGKATYDIENIKTASPFKNLIQKIYDQIVPFAEADHQSINSLISSKQEIIKYYLKVGLYQQAVTLSRELIVTLVCKLKGFEWIKERETYAEKYINEQLPLHKENLNLKQNKNSIEHSELIEIWYDLSEIRNDINHASMRENPIKTTIVNEKIVEFCEKTLEITQKLLNESK